MKKLLILLSVLFLPLLLTSQIKIFTDQVVICNEETDRWEVYNMKQLLFMTKAPTMSMSTLSLCGNDTCFTYRGDQIEILSQSTGEDWVSEISKITENEYIGIFLLVYDENIGGSLSIYRPDTGRFAVFLSGRINPLYCVEIGKKHLKQIKDVISNSNTNKRKY